MLKFKVELYQKKIENYERDREIFKEKQDRLAHLAKLGYDIPEKQFEPEMPLLDCFKYKATSCEKGDLDFPESFWNETRDQEKRGNFDEEEAHERLQRSADKLNQIFEADEEFEKKDKAEFFPQELGIDKIPELSKTHKLDVCAMNARQEAFVVFFRAQTLAIYRSVSAKMFRLTSIVSAEICGELYRVNNLLFDIDRQFFKIIVSSC